MMYWAKTNGTEINTAVFFVNLAIEEMVKKKLNWGGPVEMYEISESGISPLMVYQELHKKPKKILGGKRRKINLKGQELKRRHSR